MKLSRLAELQRQRELVREHLAWLDREIAATLGDADRHALPAPPRAASGVTSSTPVDPQPDPGQAAASARRGCFIVAAVVALLAATTLATIYFVRYRDRPLIFVEEPANAPAR